MPFRGNTAFADDYVKDTTPNKCIPICRFCRIPLSDKDNKREKGEDISNEKYLKEKHIENLVPKCVYEWTLNDVMNWIAELGFPQYQNVMAENLITGKKLILLEASNLCKMGIKDFKHIQKITASVRDLLGIKLTCFNRSIVLPRREPLALFLEQKRLTGKKTDQLTYSKFLKDNNLHYDDP